MVADLAGDKGIEGFEPMNTALGYQCIQGSVDGGWRDFRMVFPQLIQYLVGFHRTTVSIHHGQYLSLDFSISDTHEPLHQCSCTECYIITYIM